MNRGGEVWFAQREVGSFRESERTSPEPADVIAFTDGKLARYKMPKQVEFVDELPRNPQGKILKRVLRDQYGES